MLCSYLKCTIPHLSYLSNVYINCFNKNNNFIAYKLILRGFIQPKPYSLQLRSKVLSIYFQAIGFHFQLFSSKFMQSSQLLTPKRQHYNRFAYLLEPNKEGQKPQIQKGFNFFSINPCFQKICKSQQAQSQVKEKQTILQSNVQNSRKPLKYELQSQKYQLFIRQIDKKSSVDSFFAYTPQKSQIKDQFSIYNDISTIQNTKSNQMHTHRNLFESILEQEPEPINRSVRHSWKVSTLSGEEIGAFLPAKPEQNQLIKLELSESDDQSKESDTRFIKKHLRTMTQGNYDYQHRKDNNFYTVQKSTRFKEFIRKSQIESIEVSGPSKNDSIEYSSIQETLNDKDKKWTGIRISTLKTKKMSQKLQESSDLQYQNSISLGPKNSQSFSVFGSHKKIKLVRKTIDKS